MRALSDYDTPDLLDNIGKLLWVTELLRDRADQAAWRLEATEELWRLIDELHRRREHVPIYH
jgi:hypothetical protein